MWLTLSLYHGMVWFHFIVCNIQQAQYKPWLTHLPMDKMAAILANDIFKCVFLNQYFIIPIQVSLIFVPMSPVCQRPRPRLLASLSNTASGLGYGWISTSIWISRMQFTHPCIFLISSMAVSSNCRWTMACVFNMMASSNGNIFRVTGLLCGEFTGHHCPHKGQWRGALACSLICVWRKGWVNNRDAGD